MDEEWLRLEEFPEYGVSNHGEIANLKRDRLVRASFNRQGIPIVSLYRGQERLTRSVPLLVASSFIPDHPSHYNSPLHLNGDKANCRVDNLVWRPRGFTGKYYEQFDWDWFHEPARSDIVNLNTSERYENYHEPCIQYGIRAIHIVLSIHNEDYKVFPTWHKYHEL